MGFYNSPEDMYKARAERARREADEHWAKAKTGQGDWHYGKAKKRYEDAARNEARAKEVRGKTFNNRRGV